MKKPLHYLRYFRNFYVLTGTIALVWMLFFDKYNLFSQYKQNRKVSALETQLNFCRTEKQRISGLGVLEDNNLPEIERFVREEYWMKRDDEDLFIVVKK
jgi:hypothetical protein